MNKIQKIYFFLLLIVFMNGCATTGSIQETTGAKSPILEDSGFATEVTNLWLTQSVKDKRQFFTNDEKEITYYAIFTNLTNINLFQAKIYTVEWIDPSGAIYFADRVSTSYGNNNLVYSKLKVKGNTASERPGTWKCRFYRSGVLLDESQFILESPGVREKRLAELQKIQEETQISKIKETFDKQKGVVYEINVPQQITKIVEENDNLVALLIIVNEEKNIIGTGSGFLVADGGILVTNYHVIKNAKGGVAKFQDRKIYSIKSIEAVDIRRDLALVKIDYANDKYITLGDSDSVQVGERIVAIGSPFALANSVSDGLVSGIRKVNNDYSLVQVSAAISPGSSGGPLFNLSGKVIGVTSSGLIAGGAQNINFAIPINYVKELMKNYQPVALKVDPNLTTQFEGYQQFKNK